MKLHSGKLAARRRLNAAVLVYCVSISTGWAVEEKPAPTLPVEKVTGSNIARPARAGSLPVMTLDREFIEQSGATNAPELIRSLPVMQNGGGAIAVRRSSFRPQR